MSGCEGSGVCDVIGPGGCLVVAGAGFQAAVLDADEAVADLAEGGVAALAAGALLVVAGAGAGGGGAGGEGPGGRRAALGPWPRARCWSWQARAPGDAVSADRARECRASASRLLRTNRARTI